MLGDDLLHQTAQRLLPRHWDVCWCVQVSWATRIGGDRVENVLRSAPGGLEVDMREWKVLRSLRGTAAVVNDFIGYSNTGYVFICWGKRMLVHERVSFRDEIVEIRQFT